jgi:hypothetical protein
VLYCTVGNGVIGKGKGKIVLYCTVGNDVIGKGKGKIVLYCTVGNDVIGKGKGKIVLYCTVGYDVIGKGKGKGIPVQALGSRSLRLPDLKNNCHMKMVILLALRTGRLYPPANFSGTHSC